ncbi:MAG: BlaI/MecI/CopY family transcriptional regulator [Euzebyales bacterium]|nr:BlaI/MecI/CopY family transcriptional regulator [Euzebyales bacterium]
MGKRRIQLDGVLGPLETEVMEAVWDCGEVTVRDVHATLAGRRDLAYTTVMTTMARLTAKGVLTRDTSGLAHRYRAAVSRDEYAQTTVHSVVDWLVTSFPEPAMSYFVDVVNDDADPEVIDALRAKIERLRLQEG